MSSEVNTTRAIRDDINKNLKNASEQIKLAFFLLLLHHKRPSLARQKIVWTENQLLCVSTSTLDRRSLGPHPLHRCCRRHIMVRQSWTREDPAWKVSRLRRGVLVALDGLAWLQSSFFRAHLHIEKAGSIRTEQLLSIYIYIHHIKYVIRA